MRCCRSSSVRCGASSRSSNSEEFFPLLAAAAADELLDALLGGLAHALQRLTATLDAAAQVAYGLVAELYEPAQQRQRQAAPAAAVGLLLGFVDDLREGDAGQILAAVVVDDAHILARLD